MQSIKRDIGSGILMSALTLAFALTWGSPFIGPASARAQEQTQPQQPAQSPAKTFTGTVVKDGNQYTLRDSSGKMYTLDDPDRAKAFEGKAVKVTGQLDEQAMVIHVQDIQSSEG